MKQVDSDSDDDDEEGRPLVSNITTRQIVMAC